MVNTLNTPDVMAGNRRNYERFLSDEGILPALWRAERTGRAQAREEATVDKFHLEHNCVLWGYKEKHWFHKPNLKQ